MSTPEFMFACLSRNDSCCIPSVGFGCAQWWFWTIKYAPVRTNPVVMN